MANPDFGRVEIGSLRWLVTVATRVQVPDISSPRIVETLANLLKVRANIEPIGAMTFLAGQQTDRPITHRIRMRWLDWIDETCIVIRTTVRADRTTRIEVFRVRRIKEIDGRKRFIEIEAELERRA